MLKYVVSYLSNSLDYLFEDAVKPSDNANVSGRFRFDIVRHTGLLGR